MALSVSWRAAQARPTATITTPTISSTHSERGNTPTVAQQSPAHGEVHDSSRVPGAEGRCSAGKKVRRSVQHDDRDGNHEENPNTGCLQANERHKGAERNPQKQPWAIEAVRNPCSTGTSIPVHNSQNTARSSCISGNHGRGYAGPASVGGCSRQRCPWISTSVRRWCKSADDLRGIESRTNHLARPPAAEEGDGCRRQHPPMSRGNACSAQTSQYLEDAPSPYMYLPECPALLTRIGEIGGDHMVGCHSHLIRIDYAFRGVRRNANGVCPRRKVHRVYVTGVRRHTRYELRAGIGFNIDHPTGRERSSSACPGEASDRTGRRRRTRHRNSTGCKDRNPVGSGRWARPSLPLTATAQPGNG